MRSLFAQKCKVSNGFLYSVHMQWSFSLERVASITFLSSQSIFFFIFLDWHMSEASLGRSYRHVQQMGQQCQALLWWRSCQTYGRVPGITWHHCAAVSNAGSWTTRQESGKLYHNAPKWSRQGNEPLFKVSWLFPCWIKYLQSTCFLWPIRPKTKRTSKKSPFLSSLLKNNCVYDLLRKRKRMPYFMQDEQFITGRPFHQSNLPCNKLAGCCRFRKVVAESRD